MKSILIACPIVLLAFAANAQNMPSVPKVPSGDQLPMSAPSVPTPGTSTPSVTQPSAGSTPGAGKTMDAIQKAKIEAECKLPTNATKPECIKLMLKQ